VRALRATSWIALRLTERCGWRLLDRLANTKLALFAIGRSPLASAKGQPLRPALTPSQPTRAPASPPSPAGTHPHESPHPRRDRDRRPRAGRVVHRQFRSPNIRYWLRTGRTPKAKLGSRSRRLPPVTGSSTARSRSRYRLATSFWGRPARPLGLSRRLDAPANARGAHRSG